MIEREQKEDEAIGLSLINFEQFCELVINASKECIDFVWENCTEVIPSVDSNLVSSLLKILSAFLHWGYINLHKIEN